MLKNKKIIENLTLEQKASLMSGKNTWESQDIPEKIPAIFMSDGPHGLRKQVGEADHLGLNASLPATCFPTAATLANSWDEDLVYQVGTCIGEEAKALNVNVVLGPGLNIKRNPKCGRNFEYYSEDPYLAGKLAASSIRGIQANGTIASPKHFAVNSQEYRRMASDSIVDERTLREIYTTNFEIAVKEGQPKSIMSSYNLVNGNYANEDSYLLRDLLKEEWGFDGFVVSDWGGDNDHTAGVKNGSHLAMPTLGKNGTLELVNAVENGELEEAVLDQRVDEFLSVVQAVDFSPVDGTIDWQKHHEVAKKAAMESIVMLKNEANILPLTSEKKVAVIGDFAQTPRYQGAGSSVVNAKNLETTLDVIGEYPLTVVGFAKGYERGGKSNDQLVNEALELAKKSDVILLYAGLDEILESEGMDRTTIDMPKNQLALIQELAAAKKPIVVVLSAGSVVECSWEKEVQGILHGYLGGEAGASAMLEVICGHHNPSGKLNETYPISYQDVPFGKEFPAKGRYVYYKEGLYVGYRYYDKAQKAVRYPFGYGLSYSSFQYSELMITNSGVQAVITNVGEQAGSEIVQLYIGKSSSPLVRPTKELKGFVKVFLQPGESKMIELAFDDKSFRYYDVESRSWKTESGEYNIMLASSVKDIRLEGKLLITGTEPEDYVVLPNYQAAKLEEVTLADFEKLYGQKVPQEETSGQHLLNRTSIIDEMNQAKNPLARFVHRIIRALLKRSEKKGKPDLNLLFISNMPFRAIAKMTNGMVSLAMVDEMLVMVNGHFFKGFAGLTKQFFQNRKLQKAK
ncbi:glycoside hydrolase family 3 C-terminal domain-containing protein [Enterococcus sp. AZ072]|uniref:glycoside hydrolase family 3 C-terminal domain-containing protein n=1 Tax=unclassified Enterococcus TaxID=2608891 RepID=UPI003D28697A